MADAIERNSEADERAFRSRRARPPTQGSIVFIGAHKRDFRIEPVCRVLMAVHNSKKIVHQDPRTLMRPATS